MVFQAVRVSLFESFLISVELVECFQKVSEAKFARLTEGFSPRDLKKAAANMEMEFSDTASKYEKCNDYNIIDQVQQRRYNR